MAVAKTILKMMETSSWIRKMFEEGGRLKAQYGADKVYDFSIGNPNVPPPDCFIRELNAAAQAVIPGKHSYMPNAGYAETRAAVAEYLAREQNAPLKTEHIVMTAGAAAAMNVALKTIMAPGEKVIVVRPFFMEYNSYVANHGGVIVVADCDASFNPDLSSIEKHMDASNAALIINSPNNPSGTVYSRKTLAELADLLERKSRDIGRRIYLVSDEPYRNIVYDDVEVPSVMEAYPHTLVCSSYSKELSVPGERIGWLAIGPRAEDAANLIGGAVLCNRILGYVNAPALMQRVIGRLQGERVDMSLYAAKREKLCSILEKAGYDFAKPAGTFYVFPKAPGGDDIAFVSALQKERILTVPGSGFGLPGYFRIAFCVEDSVIAGAASGFAAVRKAYG